MQKNIIPIITGQTATGKTQLGIELARAIGGDLISADARQVYRYLDIITGKDIVEKNYTAVTTTLDGFHIGFYTVQGIRIWLYDVVDPHCYFSAYHWSQCVEVVLSQLKSTGRVPIMVGGSYFYIRFLIDNISASPGKIDWEKRLKFETMPITALQEMLRHSDPKVFSSLNHSDANNKRRLIRWIEKAKHPKSGTRKKTTNPLDGYKPLLIGLYYRDTKNLQKSIEHRVQKRLKAGALEEVRELLSRGYTKNTPGLLTPGYRELIDFINGDMSFDEAQTRWVTKERQYAKRQYTLIKKDTRVEWHSVGEYTITALLKQICGTI